MHSILFSTSQGAPIAILGLSAPIAPSRHCIFVVAAQDSETFDSPEAQVILPDRPQEYACGYSTGETGTTVEFENQNGWRFLVELDMHDAGTWSATKSSETLRGSAMSLAQACTVADDALAEDARDHDPGPVRRLMSSLRNMFS